MFIHCGGRNNVGGIRSERRQFDRRLPGDEGDVGYDIKVRIHGYRLEDVSGRQRNCIPLKIDRGRVYSNGLYFRRCRRFAGSQDGARNQDVGGEPPAFHGTPTAAIVIAGTGKESGNSQQQGIAVGSINNVVNIQDLADQQAVLLVENEWYKNGLRNPTLPWPT